MLDAVCLDWLVDARPGASQCNVLLRRLCRRFGCEIDGSWMRCLMRVEDPSFDSSRVQTVLPRVANILLMFRHTLCCSAIV